MTEDDLQCFCVLADCENLMAAAKQLAIVPSTLSRVLVRIEHKVGVQLFDRTSRGLRLNEFGRLYLSAAQSSLTELNVAQAKIADLAHPEEGEIRLAYLESAGAWFADQFLTPFRRLAPQIRIHSRTGTTESLSRDLSSGSAHFIVSSAPPDAPHCDWVVLKRERLYLAVSSDNALAGRSTISLKEAESENFILSTRGDSILRRPIRELCARAGIQPKITSDISDFATTRILVAAGLGVAILPKSHLDAPPADIVYLELLEDGAYRDLGVAWAKDKYLPPPSDYFRRFLLSHRPENSRG